MFAKNLRYASRRDPVGVCFRIKDLSPERSREVQAHFGMNTGQSLGSGYTQYYRGADLYSVGIATSSVWRGTDRLHGVSFGSWNRLINVAAASPLVTGPAASPNQFVLMAAISGRFEW
jgi:MipA family protein